MEIDRGSEPLTGRATRKSVTGAVDAFCRILREQTYRGAYGIRANLLSLWVFTQPGRARKFLDTVSDRAASIAGSFLVQAAPGTFPRWTEISASVAANWQRSRRSAVCLLEENPRQAQPI